MTTRGKVVVLRVGSEGGSIQVLARAAGGGHWQFFVRTIDQTAALFAEDDEPGQESRSDSETFDSLASALAYLDRYPWARLYPLLVHPKFRTEILEAVRERLTEPEDSTRISDWESAPSS